MDVRNFLLITFIIIMLVLYLIAIPLARKKSMEKKNQDVSKFQDSVKISDTVMMAAGIVGVVKNIGIQTISLEVAKDTIIEIDKMSVVGKMN